MTHRRQSELFSDWLDSHIDYEHIKKKDEFTLETMRYLVERFRHPERCFHSVHVAGSKGKGSVSAMVARIFEVSGHSTGLYTSPHMIDFTERVGTASGPFDDTLYGKAADIVVPLVDSIIPSNIPGHGEPSWFELVTLFAFVAFREAGLDWAVIETGLGGRLDATNVIMPRACVITPIELEHTEYLGTTVSAIAGEKAGIIKDGVPLFMAPQAADARIAIETAAARHRAPVFAMDDAIRSVSADASRHGLDITIAFNRLPGGAAFSRPLATRLRMPSLVQAQNAALAAYTAKFLFPDMDESLIEEGLARAWLPGRFEILDTEPPIVLDGAHTIRSLSLTVETFHAVFPGHSHVLFACASDKDVEAMSGLLVESFDRVTLTKPGSKKPSDLPRAIAAFEARGYREGERFTVNESCRDAITGAIRRAKSEGVPLLVTGSFYLVTEAKMLLS